MSKFKLELKMLITLQLLLQAQSHLLTLPRNVIRVPVNYPTASVPEMAHIFLAILTQKM
jgi:hypothetical protein